ncbi:hypothetical protein LMG27177_02696 [Paraburkholderia fynbosensis]|uniref:Uncharacterized protein n=1 Tax=Paraburkholderia fynbosensis TaxID=1200993 RepID=A0A6J5FYQ1_9BURK|nr:hypothetical protein LMG27177_02696 [Paraburkholderia fynbosensis]
MRGRNPRHRAGSYRKQARPPPAPQPNGLVGTNKIRV